MTTEPTTTEDVGTIVGRLSDDPTLAEPLVRGLGDERLVQLAEAVRTEQRRRAIENGDEEAVIADAFETGFGRDGLGVLPWIEGGFVVCPGAIVSKSRASHRCRFVSVDDEWIWQSPHLLNEVKRASPGTTDGFRAVALLPVVDGLEIDVVSGKARQGQHSVDRVVSYEIRGAELVEVSQRAVTPAGMA